MERGRLCNRNPLYIFFLSFLLYLIAMRAGLHVDFSSFRPRSLSNRKERIFMLERDFQRKLIAELKILFPGSVVLKNDPNYIQGIPDILLLFKNRWAMLECKNALSANRRPNQEYYVEKLNGMSFARFISPENKEEVLHDLQQAFGVD